MDEHVLRRLLAAVRAGEVGEDEALRRLKHWPVQDLGFARYDTHRALRRGFPEVILGQGKTPEQVTELVRHAASHHAIGLCTRLDAAAATHVLTALHALPGLVYLADARCLVWGRDAVTPRGAGRILVVCAGTADLPVAREAVLTAEVLGNEVELIPDVGVAGLHRVLSVRERLAAARVLIVVAGMEGALPSVVAGLVDRPVIAVPTSVGYGMHLHGLTALLAMLNSCVPGITLVNVDNGFGAAYAASLINRLPVGRDPDEVP